MAISVAHMSLEFVKHEQRNIIAMRANKRALELDKLRKVIQRKKDAALVEFFFAFQLFLAGAFITAMWHA
jgi:hypothetical protein